MFSAKPTSKESTYQPTRSTLIDHTSDLLKMLLKNKVTIEHPKYSKINNLVSTNQIARFKPTMH